jgi:arylsulfatase A-like enzyme
MIEAIGKKIKTLIPAAGLCLLTAASVAQARKPNIIIIYADDLGYGDLSSYGGEIPTPNIDRIGREGIRFTDFYDAAPVCTPSRYSLLTGAYPMRSMHQLTKALMPADKNYLDHRETTLAQYLKQAHYATALIGKWHLGQQTPASSPTDFGFDEFTGFKGGAIDYYYHAYASLPLDWYVHDHLQQEKGYSTDLMTDHAIGFIRQEHARQTPFFLYLSYNAPHYGKTNTDSINQGYTIALSDAKKTGANIINSLQAPREYVDRFAAIKDPYRRVYAAMVASLDDNVGKLIAALEQAHMLENTMIWFISDNGGYSKSLHGHASNGSLRGEKASLYEGGIRVPAMVWWQKSIKPGQVSHIPVCNVDLVPTLAALTGTSTALHSSTIDGKDIGGVLFQHRELPRDLFWQYGQQTALRSGNWKLVNGTELYDLSTDKEEKTDLAGRYPAKLAELKEKMAKAEARLRQGNW